MKSNFKELLPFHCEDAKPPRKDNILRTKILIREILKKVHPYTFLLIAMLILEGCNSNHGPNSPVLPLQATNLSVSLPTNTITGSLLGVSANEVLYQVSGPAMQTVSGVVGPINATGNSGTINFTIPLSLGPSRLLAFQLNDAANQQPLAVGAVQMDFTSQPAAPIVVEMGSVARNCYSINTGLFNDGSYFAFETDALANAATVVSSSGYDVDFLPVTIGSSVGFQMNALNSDTVAYMGNGNLVQFAMAPTSGYVASSTAAKQAAGASVTLIQAGDIYCMKLAGGGHVWLQISGAGSSSVGPSFRFRVNTTLAYYAYEQTAIDLSGNCPNPLPTATSTTTFTPTPTPTPTLTHTFTISPTPTVSNTPTNSLTPTSSSTPTNTPTVTLTPSVTNSPTVTPTFTTTHTPTETPTSTPSLTSTNSPTITLTPTISNTPTVTFTITPTFTPGGAAPLTVSGLVNFSLGEVNSVQPLYVILAPASGGAQQAVAKVTVNDGPFTVVSTAGSYNLLAVDDYASMFNNGGGVPNDDNYGYYVGAGVSLSCALPGSPVITGSMSGLAVTVNTNCLANTQTPYISPLPTGTPTPSYSPTPTFSVTPTVTLSPTPDTPVAYWTANDVAATGYGTYPSGIAVNAAGTTVYIDFFTPQDPDIQIWAETAAGSNLYSMSADVSIGYNGTEAGPYGLTTDNAGNVYAAAFNLNQGVEMNSTLTSVTPIGNPATVTSASPGYLYEPWDIAVDGSGNVYITDSDPTYTVQTFGPSTSSFPYIASWTANPLGGGKYYEASIAVNNAGTTVYSAPSPWINSGVTFISLYSPAGAPQGSWSGTSFANAFEPTAMAVAPVGSPFAGNIYITDIQYNQVDEFNASGTMVGSWGNLSYPYGIAVDGQGYIYVANNVASLSPGNVLKFNPR